MFNPHSEMYFLLGQFRIILYISNIKSLDKSEKNASEETNF